MKLRRVRRSHNADPRSGTPGETANPHTFESTVDDWALAIAAEVRPYTMTTMPRIVSVIDATHYVVEREISGALVECGVWRGGSILAMIRTLQHRGVADRDIYLFDTFDGMTEPGEADTSKFDGSATDAWRTARAKDARPWGHLFQPEVFNLADLRSLLTATGYPESKLHYVEGPVERTIPGAAPTEIAVLRLDTDWYESTRHELNCLFPALRDGGVLIIDDYGHWEGCRRAVDEYFANNGSRPLLHRIDYTGRMAIKH